MARIRKLRSMLFRKTSVIAVIATNGAPPTGPSLDMSVVGNTQYFLMGWI